MLKFRKLPVLFTAGLIALSGSAAQARYIQADPIGLAGGMNPYSYAGQNPTKWVDPTGLDQAPPGQWDSTYNLSGTNPPYSDSNNAMATGMGCMAACVNELYSPTGATAQCASAAAAYPLSKDFLDVPVVGGASDVTNPISYAGFSLNKALKPYGMSIPQLPVSVLGTNKPFYVVGRANVLATEAMALYTGSAVATCMASCQSQGGF